MTKELKKAWKQTKKKWEHIIEAKGKDINTYSCGLCDLYHYCHNMEISLKDCCKSCPVYKITGKFNGKKSAGCVATPFIKWTKTWSTKDAELEYMFLLFVYEATKNE